LSKLAAVEVTVEAALTGKFDLFVEALMADGSVSEPAQAALLARDLIEAHRPHLPQFN
jgi:alpha-galactosidase/6-phospho-beta-glucosidase family protein